MDAYLGIDVSKGYADFTLLDAHQNELEKVFQLDDTRTGHNALKRELYRCINYHHLTMVYCAVESTGGFENNWYSALIEFSKLMPVKVARLNPSGVKNNAAATLARNITDALSSRYIAQYLIAHPDKVQYEKQDEYYASFRSIHKHIMLLKKQKTQLVNELKMVLYSAFPEVMPYCKQSIPQWILELLVKYPGVSAIAKRSVSQLTCINHITVDKATALIEKAKTSVASRTNKQQEFLVKSVAKQIQQQQELIELHKAYLTQSCTGDEVTLLQSIPGIAAYSAASIMIELEDISRFASTQQLASYFGVHPIFKQSGDKQGAFRMSKKGRASMRAVLYMCAQTSVLFDEHLKTIYERHRHNGKNHKQAIGAIMHKLLRIIWGVLSSRQPYQANIDRKNQAIKPAVIAVLKNDGSKKKRRISGIGH